MRNRKLVVGVTGLCLAVGMSGVAVAANTAAVPKSVTVKWSRSFNFKPNRFIKDGLRFNKDVYKVKSGGTVNFLFNITDERPHTFTVIKKKDLPRTPRTLFGSPVLNALVQAHGADPNSEAPPK